MKNKYLNEEINRIKSLFTEERLYGNLSEQKFDYNFNWGSNATPGGKPTIPSGDISIKSNEIYKDLYNLIDKGERTFIRENKFYKTYVGAIENWNKVYKSFGWSDMKIINGLDIIIDKILPESILPNNIINPTSILEKLFKVYQTYKNDGGEYTDLSLEKIINEQFNYTWDSDKKSDSVVSSEPSSIGLTTPNKNNFIKEKDKGKLYTHKGDPYEYKYYEEDDSWFTRKKGSNGKWLELDKEKNYDAIKKLEDRHLGGEKFRYRKEIKGYVNFLTQYIQIHNENIKKQSLKLLEKVCGEVKIGERVYGYTNIGKELKTDVTYSMSKICGDGGVFIYFLEESKNDAFCSCVINSGVKKITINNKIYEIDLNNLEPTFIDTRDFSKKVIDWVSDWHNIADVASILILFSGPQGPLLSGLIDLVSGLGYVVEKEEGWQLNAGLTLLGAFFGLKEAKELSFAGKSTFNKKLINLNDILLDNSIDPALRKSRISLWYSSLDDAEKQLYKKYKKLVYDKNSKQLKKILEDYTTLSNTEKGFMDLFLEQYSNNTDYITKLMKNNNNDIRLVLKNFIKENSKKLISIQGGLFIGLQYGVEFLTEKSIEILKFLNEKYDYDPFNLFDNNNNITEKKLDYNIEYIKKMNKEIGEIKKITLPILKSEQEKQDDIASVFDMINSVEEEEVVKDSINSENVKNEEGIKSIENLKNNLENKKNNNDMNIKEEIERIKSLFNDDRLYGNLINEVCDNEDEAKKLLQDKGYIIGDTNPCYDPNFSDIGKAIKLFKDKGQNDFKITEPVSTGGGKISGCSIKFMGKTSTVDSGKFTEITLFDFEQEKRFVIYYKYKVDDACKKSVTVPGMAGKKVYNPTGNSGDLYSDIRYGKIEGDWGFDGSSDITFRNAVFLKNLNSDGKNPKQIPKIIQDMFPNFKITFKDPNNPNACIENYNFISEKYGNLNGTKNIQQIIDLIKS